MQKILFAETNLVATEQFEELASEFVYRHAFFQGLPALLAHDNEVLRDYSDGFRLEFPLLLRSLLTARCSLVPNPMRRFRGIIDLELQRSAVRSQNYCHYGTESSKNKFGHER